MHMDVLLFVLFVYQSHLKKAIESHAPLVGSKALSYTEATTVDSRYLDFGYLE